MLAPITRLATLRTPLPVGEALSAVKDVVLPQGGRQIDRESGAAYEFGNAFALRMLGVWSRRGARRIPVVLTVDTVREGDTTRLTLSLSNDTPGYLFYGPAVVARLEHRYDELMEAITRSLGAQTSHSN